MEDERILREINALPPEAQQQVVDFVAFLRMRYAPSPCSRKAAQGKLADEPFVGMWRDREGMQDSRAWVRMVREREWKRE